MKLLFRLVLLGAVAGGLFFAWKSIGKSEAYAAYEKFADAMVRGKFDDAKPHATGAALTLAEGGNYDRNFRLKEMIGEVESVRRKILRETKGDGEVTFEMEQSVCRIPVGVSSAICKWWVDFKQDVQVVKEEGAWKVASFEQERIEREEATR